MGKWNYRKSDGEIENSLKDMGYELLNREVVNGATYVSIKDNNEYKYYLFLGNLMSGHKPLFVSSNNPYSLDNISVWLNKNNKSFSLLDNQRYVDAKETLQFSCFICTEVFDMGWDSVYHGRGCQFCSGRKVGNFNNFGVLYPDLLKEWNPENEINPYYITKGSDETVSWICSKCNHVWDMKVAKRTGRGDGCPRCSGKIVSDNNRITVLYPDICLEWEYDRNNGRLPENFSKGSEESVYWKCKMCDGIWEAQIYSRVAGNGCPNCSSSKGEKSVTRFLNKNNVYFLPQYFFDDCKNILRLPFDFYLPDYNCVIEYDGIQHFEAVDFNGQGIEYAQEQFQSQQFRDSIKNKYCQDNNMFLLRIPYWEFDNIESILTECLSL